MVWNSGVCAALRGGLTSSTTRSKGRSVFFTPARTVARTRRSNSEPVGASANSTRRARVLTTKPMTPPTSPRRRLAVGVPTTRSRCPDSRDSTIDQPVSSVAKSDPSCSSVTALSAAVSSGPISRCTRSPEWFCSAGRGRSVGSSSSGGAPASFPAQYSSCAAGSPPAIHCRWRRVKSVYCHRTGGSGSGSPCSRAA